jgi:hypothetical protein
MEDRNFFALAAHINKLVSDYQAGLHKHHIYATEYDKALEQYKITKKQWIAEINKRSKARQQSSR